MDPNFENRLPMKEIGPFDITNDDKKNKKEAVDLNKKAMCQFIQALPTMSLLSKVNLQKKADKLFPSGRAWKLWLELQGDFNPDNSIAETELELALSKLRLTNKKNRRKLLEEIASREVKYGVPVSNGKKVTQLIPLGGKKFGTVITVTQMCKKREKVTFTAKHIVDKMWKQWRIEGGKEKGEENADDKEETTLSKVDEKGKFKGKDRSKDKDDKGKKKETHTCNHCRMKGHIDVNCWKKNPLLMPEKFKGKKTEKAGAAVEEEHLLSFIDANGDDVDVDYEFHNDGAFVQVELSLKDKDVEEKSLSQIRTTLQALNSPNKWIGDTGGTRHSTKYKQGGINSRPSMNRTRGIPGKVIEPSMEVDLPGMYCDKHGDDQFTVRL